VDADPQGNVGASLGIASRVSLYHVLIENAPVESAVIPIRDNLHILPADDSLAAAEIRLAKHVSRANVLRNKLDKFKEYDYVIVDCGPSLSLINQNVLCFAEEVLVPVSCDYLALIGVKQVLKTIKNINKFLQHPLKLGAILPTQYDQRARICVDALKALQDHFKEKCLPPIRNNTRLKEAPSHKKTIYEHDAKCYGAIDYMHLVNWLLERTEPREETKIDESKDPAEQQTYVNSRQEVSA
jgi:chromosome partitioning protein